MRAPEEGDWTGPRAFGHGTVEWSVVGLATGRRPFRRIHPPTRPCLRRSNGHAGQTDMSHARERGGHRGGRGGCGPGRAADTARDRRQVRPPPSSLCSLSSSPRRPPLPAFHSSPSSPSSPPFPSSPLSLECRLLAAEPHRHTRTWRWRRAPPCTPLPSSPRLGLQSPRCCRPCCPSASVPTRIPPQTAQLGLGTGVASHLPTTHRHARRPSPRGRCV